jgi:hypothetical protein
MNLDKEYAGLFELVAWLKQFKEDHDAQHGHLALTVVPEPVQLHLEHEPSRPADYRKLDRSAANAGKAWAKEDTRIAWFAYNGGCTLKEIARYLDRTENSLKKHIDKIKAGIVEL